jgi:hypothetical protein
MEGTRLMSVKNGLCAVVAGLADDDLINISSFSEDVRSITGGFEPVSTIRRLLPRYLSSLDVEGSTALYNATVDGIVKLRETFESHRGVEEYKYALLVLTDGADTASSRSNESVLRYLAAPGIDRLMVVLVAVEMGRGEEELLQTWVSMRHCKQISVNIRSGKKLVQIFGEALMDRIIISDPLGPRFYNCSNGSTPYQDSADDIRSQGIRQRIDRSSSPVHLSADLLRTLGDHSPNVSRAASVTGGSDYGNEWDDDISVDFSRVGELMRSDRLSSPICDPTYSPSYSPSSSPPRLQGFSDFNSFENSYQNPTVFRDPLPKTLSSRTNNEGNHPIAHRSLDAEGKQILVDAKGNRIVVDEIDNNGQFFRDTHVSSRSNSISSQDDSSCTMASTDEGSTPAEICCPISHEVMKDPVLCADGHTYERSYIEEWMRTNSTSPLTGKSLPSTNLVPNHALRSLIENMIPKTM